MFRRGGTSADPGFSDLLNYYRPVADGVLVLKDEQGELTGPLMGGWWYTGPDFENQSADELARLSNSINAALRRLDIGWMLNFEAIVVEEDSYIRGDFDNAVDRMINDERRRSASHYATRYAFFLTQAPSWFDKGRGKQLRSAVLGASVNDVLDELGTRLKRFEKVMSEVEEALHGDVKITRMRYAKQNDELLQALQLIVNGELKRCRLPEDNETYDRLLARDLVWSPDMMKHGEQYTAVVSLFAYPSHTKPGLLSALTSLGIPLRWSTRFIILDQRVAHRQLTHLRRTWFQKVEPMVTKLFGMRGPIDANALDRTAEVDAELKNLASGEVAYGHWTSVVVTRGATQADADARARLVIQELKRVMFEARMEGLNKLEALIGSFPGHGRQNVRKPLMHTLHLADLMPLAREWEGSPTNPCPFYPANSPPLGQVRTWAGGAFNLNLHVGDLGHTLIMGPPGAGKSTLLAWLCSQFMRYWRSRVFVLDNGSSMLALTLARRDGAFYPLGTHAGLSLCPLAEIDTDEERAWAAEWLEILCDEHSVALSPAERQRIYAAVKELAEFAPSASHRTLTDLLTFVNGHPLERVLPYYTSGVGAGVLDGASNELACSRFTTFELEALMALGAKVANPTLAFIFRQIEKRLDGRPTLVVIDEAWLSLSHPRFADRLRKWLKTWRRKNCVAVLATQSLRDVVDSPIADAVFESCPTRILLPNDRVTQEMRDVYRSKLQLTDVQVATLCDSPHVAPKKWYMFCSGGRSRLFSLDLGPVQRAFLGVSGPSDLAGIWHLSREHGANWPGEWLRMRGLEEAAETYAVFAAQELTALEAGEAA
jgi:type IV secretion system protein VirB4